MLQRCRTLILRPLQKTSKDHPRYLEISHLWSRYLEVSLSRKSSFLFGLLRVRDTRFFIRTEYIRGFSGKKIKNMLRTSRLWEELKKKNVVFMSWKWRSAFSCLVILCWDKTVFFLLTRLPSTTISFIELKTWHLVSN